MGRLLLTAAAVAVLVTLVATASAGTRNHASTKAGGVYRVAFDSSFNFTDGFDPTGEYLGDAFTIYSSLLIRTLVGYNHIANGPGNKLVPDLASSWKISNGGKTYTFHMKTGIKFGPPLNREITSQDIAYAIERLAHPADGGQYSFYYSVIKGF